ncbi:hypothetical protein ABZ814_13605 [Micromonospora musae]|uniref:hypothetical protein n=1 Tax=Micromonospora musae TaxID=1894970 RepID=UPI003403BA91
MYDTYAAAVPAGETDYLAKAAEQLAKVADSIDSKERRSTPGSYRDERKLLADQYATLGAIQRGQLPAEVVKQILDRIAV